MPKFAAGVIDFQQKVFPEKKDLFEKLAKGQSPEALFITCSDSRIEPSMITQTNPGELFVCRNAGNIVPPFGEPTCGMSASIEFAVVALKVPHIVVCGHTECGAMKGAMNPTGLDSLPQIREWLDYSRAAVESVEKMSGSHDDAEKMRLLLEQNVRLQLQHLKSHPTVANALADGRLTLHGWVYDIESGAVAALDEKGESFEPLDARYANEIAKLSQHNCSS